MKIALANNGYLVSKYTNAELKIPRVFIEFIIVTCTYIIFAKYINNSAIFVFFLFFLYFYKNTWKIGLYICAIVPLIDFIPMTNLGWINLNIYQFLFFIVISKLIVQIYQGRKLNKVEISLILLILLFIPSLIKGIFKSPSISLPFIEYASLLYFLYFFSASFSKDRFYIEKIIKVFAISVFFSILVGITTGGIGAFYNTNLATYFSVIIALIINRIFNKNDIMATSILSVAVLGILFLFFIGGARSAFLTVVFATVISLSLHVRKNKLLLLFLFGGLFLIVSSLLPNVYFARFAETKDYFRINDINYFLNYGYGFVGGTGGWRYIAMIDGFKEFLKEPLIGIGAGVPVKTVFLANWLFNSSDPTSYLRPLNIHITYVAYLVLGGIVGYIGIIIFSKAIVQNFKSKNNLMRFEYYKKILYPFFFASLFAGLFQPEITNYQGALFFTLLGALYYLKEQTVKVIR